MGEPNMSEKDKGYEESFDEKIAYDVGFSMGQMDLVEKVKKAYKMGEVEDLIEHFTPKSFEEWEEYEKEKGMNYDDRWK